LKNRHVLAKTNLGKERLEDANARRRAWRKWGILKERMFARAVTAKKLKSGSQPRTLLPQHVPLSPRLTELHPTSLGPARDGV
jgi:hypothetical protein